MSKQVVRWVHQGKYGRKVYSSIPSSLDLGHEVKYGSKSAIEKLLKKEIDQIPLYDKETEKVVFDYEKFDPISEGYIRYFKIIPREDLVQQANQQIKEMLKADLLNISVLVKGKKVLFTGDNFRLYTMWKNGLLAAPLTFEADDGTEVPMTQGDIVGMETIIQSTTAGALNLAKTRRDLVAAEGEVGAKKVLKGEV